MKIWVNNEAMAVVVAETAEDAADYLSLIISRDYTVEHFKEMPFVDGQVELFEKLERRTT